MGTSPARQSAYILDTSPTAFFADGHWPLLLRSQTALFSMPRLISGINFHFHFVNQFHLFMLTSINPSVLHFPHLSPLHSFTLNSKLTFLVNLFPHRSLTIDTSFGLTSSDNGTVFCFYCLCRCYLMFLVR